MPSDPRIAPALDALSGPIESFRSMLANTSEQIRLVISTRVETNGSSVDVARAELGQFATGRIDAGRMAKLLGQVEAPAIDHGDVVRRALEICNELLAKREQLFRVDVAPGTDLRTAVGQRLAEIGRAFAATRIVELVAQGQFRPEHVDLLEGHPFEEWSHAEREIELALVVCVNGRELRAGGLSDFLDRSVKMVLVVEGDAPPAPLVRLITPKMLVIQTTEIAELESLASYHGPGVVALVSDEAAQFRHDPEAGAQLSERIVITHLPNKKPHELGHVSGFQQRQDLAQLEALAMASQASAQSAGPPANREAAPPRAPTVASPVVEAPVASQPIDHSLPLANEDQHEHAVDKLSAWLLDRAGM